MPRAAHAHLARRGSKLIGAGVQVELTREEVCNLLVEGFFPRVGLDEKPTSRRSGFQEFGLPFAPDSAVTRYLAAFLTAHRHVAIEEGEATDHDPARPDVVLFNGGVFESPRCKPGCWRYWRVGSMAVAPSPRLSSTAAPGCEHGRRSQTQPRAAVPHWQPLVLDNDRLDLAVARGAAYYGMVRRGQGVRIAAGLARTYYIGVESTSQPPSPSPSPGRSEDVSSPLPPPLSLSPLAVCLLPAGIEAGHDVELAGRRFDLLVSEPAEFPLFVSSTRLTDKPGELVPSTASG